MACGGHCNHCPGHAGYKPAGTPATWTNDPIGTLDDVAFDDFNELRLQWYYEAVRWSTYPGSWPSPDPGYVGTSHTVYHTHYRWLVDILNTITGGLDRTYLTDAVLNDGQNIQDESTEALRTHLNYLRSLCVCNCNYACTCNCNYCTCNCNHACTCNCNYSDRELKENIKYM